VIAGASPEWTAELRAVEKDLAVFLGPLARIMVKRAAAKTANLDELCKLLGQSLERDEDRDAFLQQQSTRSRSRAKTQAIPEVPAMATATTAVNPLSPLGITADAIDHAAKMLAAHVGPISMVLAKKAARRADSVQSFYRLLSEHVQNSAERRRFLRDAGFPDA
jgi:serine/threonine-protein kinase